MVHLPPEVLSSSISNSAFRCLCVIEALGGEPTYEQVADVFPWTITEIHELVNELVKADLLEIAE